jgi:uncharacterized membrane protein
MKHIISIIKTTVIGGVIFLIPFFIVVVIIMKAMELVGKIIRPWAIKLGVDGFAGKATITILVAIILILLCFVAGMIAKSGRFTSRFPMLDEMADRLIPGYEILKAQSGEAGVENVRDAWQAICLKTEDGWFIAFIVEKNASGYCTVFIPHAPKMESGEVRLLPLASMEYLPITAKEARQYLKRFGAGAAGILVKQKE